MKPQATPAAQTADPFERERAALGSLDAYFSAARANEPPVPEGYVRDAKSRLVPERMVPESAQMEDVTVRTIAAYAFDLHRQIHRFIGHCYDDLAAMDDLIAERYGLKRRGGAKGNRTYRTYDGCLEVVVQVQERIAFGPELQAARELVEECIAEWSDGARDEIKVIARHAFDTDKEGNVSREKVFALRRLEIEDERWRQAQAAITDAIRVVGSAQYVRFYIRPAPGARRMAISIDMTSQPLPEAL